MEPAAAGGAERQDAWQFDEEDAVEQFRVDVEMRSALGLGSYGSVYRATLHGVAVAAKTLHMLQDPLTYLLVGPDSHNPKSQKAKNKVLQDFKGEAAALAAVRHANVVRFIGVAYHRVEGHRLPHWIVTEALPYSLDQFCSLPAAAAAIGVAEVTYFVTDMADALKYLHAELGMVHRDLK